MEENQVVKHKITKEKHPGRVAAGKRLTEWNQQNKAKLKASLENLDQASSNASSLQAPSSSIKSPSSSISLIIFGVLALAVGGYYLWQKKPQQNVSKQNVSKQKKQEIFNPFQG